MSITLSALQKQRRDTAANWTTANPTLLAGEIGIESDTGKWKVGDGTTAWTSLAYVPAFSISNYPLVNADISATAEIAVSKLADGTARQLLQTDAAGTGVEWASNIDVPGTLDVTGAATFDAGVTIQGDLTVNGTTTTIDTQNLIVEDKNVIIGQVTTPTDVTADGGGITLKGSTDKTINWVDATDAWTFSEHVNLASGKGYYINGTQVLSSSTLGSGVTGSSLTSVGTIGTGVWQGTAINKTYLDSTLVSTGDTGTVTSTMIADGTIVNGDINASAAIAGTKISPDFGSQTVTTTGVFSHALGTAGAPTITFTGDLNTGIYSPGTDQVAISTGGTGRLFVDSSGRVGLGSSSPQGLLDLAGTKNLSSDIGQIIVRDTASYATGVGGAIVLAGKYNSSGSYTAGAYLNTRKENSTDGNYSFALGFGTIANGGAISEKMTLTSGGLLGIGTTAPGMKLTVNDTTTAQIQLGYSDSIYGRIGRNSSGNYEFSSYESGSNLLFGTTTSTGNTTERARIDSSGRLLIGTSSFSGSSKLVVQGSTNDNDEAFFSLVRGTSPGSSQSLGVIRFQGNGTTNEAAQISAVRDGGTWTSGSSHPGRLVFSTTADGASSPTERMRIEANGNTRYTNTNFVYPQTDNACGSGANGNRWSAVWAANGTIQTSDERAKTDITDAQLGIEFIKSLHPVSYKWIEGGKRHTGEYDEDNNWIYESVPGQRTHWGFIAQEVKEAVDAAGVDFGGWVLTDKDDPDSQQALRYDQFIAPLTKALQEALAKIETLEAKVAVLEAS